MIKPNIYFRADGNTKIGLGHITRSLALADMLKNDFEMVFLVQNPSEAVCQQISEVCNQIIILPESNNYTEESFFIANNYLKINDIVVLDGYKFDTEYQQIIKQKEVKLVCIDDIHTYHFVADVVINHGLSPEKKHLYSTEFYTKLCLGTEYALLRKPFLEAAKQERKIEKITTVFVCFGGSDIHNLTLKTLNTCIEIDFINEIYVIIGSAYLYRQELQEFIEKQTEKKIVWQQNLSATEMVKVMQDSDLAIVPASSVAHEVASVGMACIGGFYVDNQAEVFKFFKEIGVIFSADNYLEIKEPDLKNLISNLDSKVVQSQLKTQKKKFNGQSVANFQKIFRKLDLENQISLRKAKIEDSVLYFEWVNEPSVRLNSLNSEYIHWENHQEWFLKKIKNLDSFLYLFEFSNKKIAQVRIDFQNQVGLIDYSIDVNFRGLGLGRIILKKTIIQLRNELKNFTLNAIVKKENKASLEIFRTIGFIEIDNIDNSEFLLVI